MRTKKKHFVEVKAYSIRKIFERFSFIYNFNSDGGKIFFYEPNIFLFQNKTQILTN
jgi:hypothetical protein